MAGVDDVPEELVCVLLPPPLEVLGVEAKAVPDLGRRVVGCVKVEGAGNSLLQNAERAILPLPVRIQLLADVRVLAAEAEIGEGRGVREALEHAVQIAAVAEVPQP